MATQQLRAPAPFWRDHRWWLFCLLVLVLKFVLFGVDSLPKFYGGDSKSYLWTAISGWIPEDRSFLYGYVIRWVALSTSALTSLLVLQVFAGAIIAIVSAWICLRIFELPWWIAFTIGFLCCLDPLQLYWERAVMTETLSLLFYVLLLQRSFVYLDTRRIRDLLLVQLFSILILSFRMSYLMMVYVTTVTLPILAFWNWHGWPKWKQFGFTRSSKAARGTFARATGHLFVSVITMLLLHASYKQVNGILSHREPAYLYVTGTYLLSFWAPALKPSDATDNRVAELIEAGDKICLKNINSRPGQLYAKGLLIDRLQQIEPNPTRLESLARKIALRALRRHPIAIADLAWQTYLQFWHLGVNTWAKLEVATSGQFSEVEIAQAGLTDRFHQVVTPINVKQRLTFLGWYYLAADWYYYIVLLSPVILGIVVALKRSLRHYLVFLFLNQIILFASICALVVQPQVRYLQSLSLITLLTFAAGAKCVVDRKFITSGARSIR